MVGIARGLGVDEPAVRDDLEVISVYQVLAEGVGQAQAALSQTRRRFERLQVAAFADLREAGSFQLRRRIRTEIGRREMRLFKMLQKVGFYGRVTAGLRVGEPVADERAMDAVKHLPDEGVPYVDRGHIAAIHELVNAVVHPNQLSLFGAGSVQALKILREGRGTWSAGRKEEGSGEHAAVWARRLLVGTLLAKGGRHLQVAEALGVDRSVVYHDVRALREQQLLSHDTERTKLLLTKSLLRMEALQQAAFLELTNEEPGFQERQRIRVEITDREVATAKFIQALGIYDVLTKHFERQRPRLEDQIRWVKDPGFLEEMKTHLENLRAAKSGKGVSMKGPAKHPGKKRKRRVKKKKARAKTPEPKSMFKDKKQLSQARLLTGTRGVSRQQDVNTLYARRAYIALGGEKPLGIPPRYRFIWDPIRAEETSWGKKPTLLTELGRLPDVPKIQAMAEVVCKYEPSTTVAVTAIRAIRVGRTKLWKTQRIRDRIERQLSRVSPKGLTWCQSNRFVEDLIAAYPREHCARNDTEIPVRHPQPLKNR